MLSTGTLKTMRDGAESALKKMQAIIAKAESEIDALNKKNINGNVYKQDFLNKKLAEKRTEISDDLYKLFHEINSVKDTASQSKKYYESNSFMLSRERFDADNGINANMKMATLIEFAAMNHDELYLIAEHALAHQKLARFWCAFLTQKDKKGAADKKIGLTGIQTAEQAEGLNLIKGIGQLAASAELAMRGSTVSPFQRRISTSERLRLQQQAGQV